MRESYRDFDRATNCELAEREGIAPSYMTRVLRLTLLAKDIIEVIMDGRQEPEVALTRLLRYLPKDLEGQRVQYRSPCSYR